MKNYIKEIKKYFYDKNYVLNFLVVITGQKCSLKCRNCSNFSPYHKKDIDFYNIDKKRIVKRVKNIKCLQLQGGDFFLHKDSEKILKYISNNNKISECMVATNCLIIPKQEILDILKSPKFLVRLSFYGTSNETRVKDIENVLIKNSINYKFHHFANKNDAWNYLGGIDTPKHTKEETESLYLNCKFKVCLTLENGLISRCSRATVAHRVQNFKPKDSDFVNVRKRFFAINELKNYIQKQNLSEGVVTACYYCNGTSGKSIPAGEQLTKEELQKIRRKHDK